MLYFNALEQFEVLPFFSFTRKLVFTNFMETYLFNYFLISVILFSVVFYLKILVKSNLQILVEKFLVFVENLVVSNALLINQKDLPFFFGLTVILLVHNLSGMIPYNFTITSHFFVTFGLSFILFFWYELSRNSKASKSLFEFIPSTRHPIYIASSNSSYRIYSIFQSIIKFSYSTFCKFNGGTHVTENFRYIYISNDKIWFCFFNF